MQNISKYVQLNDFLLLEYEFSRDSVDESIVGMGPAIAVNEDTLTKQYILQNSNIAIGVNNNILELNSLPTNIERSTWFNNWDDRSRYYDHFDSYDTVSTTAYPHDTVKVHVISGYNFDDIAGFLLQVRAEDSSANMVDLSNFSYFKNDWTKGSNVVKFATQALYLGNRFYDKYVEFKIPSIYQLGAESITDIAQKLDIKALSDVFVTYSTVPTIQGDTLTDDNTFTLAEKIDVQLPVTSVADNFNALIAESTSGDYIEYYATWADTIIGQYMGDIESGRIPLYTSNNPNDNYEEFSDQYGSGTAKWVLIHELYVYEQLPGVTGGSSLLTQKFSFTQEDNFSLPNYFRPVLKNADIDASYTIQYICRLSNRMDGTQIIRRASFSSTDPKKYGLKFTRLNVENIIPYKVFNRLDSEKPNIVEGSLMPKTKYVKTFYDTTTIVYNENNEIYPQGQGPLLLKTGDSVYKFKFERLNETAGQREKVDLSGAFNYALYFKLDDETIIEAVPTYSTNMNTSIGELEFKLTGDQITKLLKQNDTSYSIIVKNPDGTSYTFYEGVYHSYITYNAEIQQETELIDEISSLKSTLSQNTSRFESDLSQANRLKGTSKRAVTALNKKYNVLQAKNKELTDIIASLESRSSIDSTKVQPIAAAAPPDTSGENKQLVADQAVKIDSLETENSTLTIKVTQQKATIDQLNKTIQELNGIIRHSGYNDYNEER
jgi:hypothetical protein